MKNTSLSHFWVRLNDHDWHYEKSDDSRYYQRGINDRAELRELAKLSPAHLALYVGFVAWSRDMFVEKPARPYEE